MPKDRAKNGLKYVIRLSIARAYKKVRLRRLNIIKMSEVVLNQSETKLLDIKPPSEALRQKVYQPVALVPVPQLFIWPSLPLTQYCWCGDMNSVSYHPFPNMKEEKAGQLMSPTLNDVTSYGSIPNSRKASFH